MTPEEPWLRTSIGRSDADSITVQGRDLASELMGKVSFTELAFLLVRGRLPEEGEAQMLDAVLVSLADHGLTPTVIAARMTHTGAPESLQGAVAAGLLGAGDVFLGVVENTARFLGGGLKDIGADAGDEALRAVAERAVKACLDSGRRVPGLGHPVHKVEDPRTPRMYELAERSGQLGPHLRLLRIVADVQQQATGRALPINGAGVAGAALADLGFNADIVRGFALIARTAASSATLPRRWSSRSASSCTPTWRSARRTIRRRTPARSSARLSTPTPRSRRRHSRPNSSDRGRGSGPPAPFSDPSSPEPVLTTRATRVRPLGRRREQLPSDCPLPAPSSLPPLDRAPSPVDTPSAHPPSGAPGARLRTWRASRRARAPPFSRRPRAASHR